MYTENITFPDNKRKIIFQRRFFGKTIFSGRLEKENMVFRAVYLTIVPANESKGKIKKYNELWIKIRFLIRRITKNSDYYDEKYMKIKNLIQITSYL